MRVCVRERERARKRERKSRVITGWGQSVRLFRFLSRTKAVAPFPYLSLGNHYSDAD